MGTLNVIRNDDRLDTMIGRLPIRVHRNRYYENYDIHLFFNMVKGYINKCYKRTIYDYNIDFNVDKGSINITFELNSNINSNSLNEKLEDMLSIVNSQLKPQLHTFYNMSYQYWDSKL